MWTNDESSGRRSKAALARWARCTDTERVEIGAKISKAVKASAKSISQATTKRWAGYSVAERSEVCSNISKSVQVGMNNLSAKDKARMTKHRFETLNKRSEEEKARCNKQRSESLLATYAAKKKAVDPETELLRFLETEEHQKHYHKKHYDENKVAITAIRKEYRKNHKEEIAIQQRKYVAGHKEKIQAYSKRHSAEHYLEHKDELLAATKCWKRDHPEATKAIHNNAKLKRRGVLGSHTAEEWLRKLAEYNNRCAYCNTLTTDTPEGSLTRDHAQPISRGGDNYIGNIVPSCMICNDEKHNMTSEEFFESINSGNEVGVLTRRFIAVHPEVVDKYRNLCSANC